MKKLIVLLSIIFIIYTITICFCPAIEEWDKNIIIYIQSKLKFLPTIIPMLPDFKLYVLSIAIPLLFGILYFIKKYLIIDAVIFPILPLIAYISNIIIKNIVQRPRPLSELHLITTPNSYSYVSSHTLVTFCLWGAVIYYLNLYCKNKFLKLILIFISLLWIIFVGISRVWIGVHNPSDIIGAYILGSIVLLCYVSVVREIGGKC